MMYQGWTITMDTSERRGVYRATKTQNGKTLTYRHPNLTGQIGWLRLVEKQGFDARCEQEHRTYQTFHK